MVAPRYDLTIRACLIRGISIGAVLATACDSAVAQRAPYPPTRRVPVVDTIFGTAVADPYRWLERLDDPATTAWVRAQQRFTARHLQQLPGRAALQRRLAELASYRRTDVPWREAGRIFYTERASESETPALYMLDSLGARPRLVLDPARISPDGSIAVSDFAVSPDGRWLAYSTSPGGADVAQMHVRGLTTGRTLGDVVTRTLGPACWTADGGGFFYVRRPPPAPGDPPNTARIEKQLFYHVLGQPQAKDRLVGEWKENYQWLYCMLSDDGRRLIAVAQRGAADAMYVMDMGIATKPDVSAPLVRLLGDRETGNTPMGTVGDTLYVFTKRDAPRGRVVALALGDGARAEPRPVIPESPNVIDWATVAGDRLVLHYLVDVTSRLELFTLGGAPAGSVSLPGIGALGWPVNGRNAAPEVFYAFTSFLSPSTVYRYDLRTGRSTPFHAPRTPFDPGAYETRQVFYPSRDGTRVPMFITARRSLRLDGTNPVMLTAYGGYGSVNSPAYSPDIPLWLEMGGVYVVANIRGGGEYGETWHVAGSREHKQTSFDDFIAAAEYLVKERYTSPSKLAIYGHSNGGLLIGAMVTQRPDLFAAAIANAGHHDMLRFHKFTVGAGWISEYGSPDDSSAFQYLRAYSPLHNVKPGTCYPATLLLTGDHDDRVVPSHSYMFAAALQAAQGCERPVLLRVSSNASHQYASAASGLAELADRWAFTAARLGVARR
jgi:prolyl oligopeptidase